MGGSAPGQSFGGAPPEEARVKQLEANLRDMKLREDAAKQEAAAARAREQQLSSRLRALEARLDKDEAGGASGGGKGGN